jgi:hypothetical protein
MAGPLSFQEGGMALDNVGHGGTLGEDTRLRNVRRARQACPAGGFEYQ